MCQFRDIFNFFWKMFLHQGCLSRHFHKSQLALNLLNLLISRTISLVLEILCARSLHVFNPHPNCTFITNHHYRLTFWKN
jgi:hypothetical protein